MDRIDKLKEYMKTAQKDSFLQHALALEYIKVGNDEGARKLFNEILKREPTYIGSYYHLGKLLERTGDPAKALKVYKRGMEVATTADDHRSFTELRVAYEDLEDIMEN
jgi:Tfp pilus assembly protein PilF